MGQLFAVEVIYRGVFQKTLAKNITRDIVLAAHNEGKLGISFGRYGDAPERNGIPPRASRSSPTTNRRLKKEWRNTNRSKSISPWFSTTRSARARSPGHGTDCSRYITR